jgi:hypothetical protein
MLIGYPQMIRNASNSQPNILIENKQIQQQTLINPELWEQQLISIYLGSLIPEIFAKK